MTRHLEEGSMPQGWTFLSGALNHGGSGSQRGTFLAGGPYRGGFNAAGWDLPR
ncbi:MAG: hypothetical protein ACI4TU_01810 [Candidatus Cryptobacteroides sp.]